MTAIWLMMACPWCGQELPYAAEALGDRKFAVTPSGEMIVHLMTHGWMPPATSPPYVVVLGAG